MKKIILKDNVILKIKEITKKFPGTLALYKVDFNLRKGEVHALVGENGAGKSTLVKILCGVYQPDMGSISLNGQKMVFKNVREAINAGIVMVFQELNLFPELSIAENIFLAQDLTYTFGWFLNRDIYKKTRELFTRIGIGTELNPKELVKNLSVGKQQMVEIAKAISQDANILILDEPTSSLSPLEIEMLFNVIRSLKEKGFSMIYISHRLEEIFSIADRVSVLRDGRKIGTTREVSDTNMEDLIKTIVGRKLRDFYYFSESEGRVVSEVIFQVKGLTQGDFLQNINFHVQRGEIVGLAGLVGAGRTELARSIFGADSKDGGEIYIEGKKVEIRCPYDALQKGLAYLTEDRKSLGIIEEMSVAQNITLPKLSQERKGFLLDQDEENVAANSAIKELSIKVYGLCQKIKFLSGGNQQKIAIAKWLLTKPKVIIFDEPTRGIDVETKAEIYRLINKIAKKGAAVVVISSDLPELLAICDRILVMCEGKITAELDREEAKPEKIMRYATPRNKVNFKYR